MGDLTAHFSTREMKCKCRRCGFDTPNVGLLNGLEKLREKVGKPVTVLSACGCVRHNAAVGGTTDSEHMRGNAADVRVAGLSALDLYRLACEVVNFSAGGIGLYVPGGRNGEHGFVHVDTGKRRRWGRLANGNYCAIAEALTYFGEGD